MFTHGCQDTGIHFCSSNAQQAHLESANDAYAQWLRNKSQHPETISPSALSLCEMFKQGETQDPLLEKRLKPPLPWLKMSTGITLATDLL
jgi:hypothetical protein